MERFGFGKKIQRRPDHILWDSPILDLTELLRQHTPQTAYVAVDFEGLGRPEQLKVFQVGVAVLPPSSVQGESGKRGPDTLHFALPLPSQTPHDMVDENQMECYSFRVTSQRYIPSRWWNRNREGMRLFGSELAVDENEAEAQLVALLTSIRDRFQAQLGNGAPPLSMVLVGYGMTMEYQIFSLCYPAVISGGFFSSWCDIQKVVCCVSGLKQPSLVNALLALGFPGSAFAPDKGQIQHQAGNDAVRELVILLHLLHHAHAQSQISSSSSSSLAATVPRHPFWHPKRAERKPRKKVLAENAGDDIPRPFNERRPRPFSAYPFTVSLRFERLGPMRSVARNGLALQKLFSEYHPVVATMKRDTTTAWVCLATEGERDRFVNDVNGKMRFRRLWRARALPVQEPSPLPLTDVRGQVNQCSRKKLTDSRRPENKDVQEMKRRERSEWRAAHIIMEREIEDRDISLGLECLGLEGDDDTM